MRFVGPPIDEIWLTFCGKGGKGTYYCLSESRRGCNGLLAESLIGSQPYPFVEWTIAVSSCFMFACLPHKLGKHSHSSLLTNWIWMMWKIMRNKGYKPFCKLKCNWEGMKRSYIGKWSLHFDIWLKKATVLHFWPVASWASHIREPFIYVLAEFVR